MRPRKILKRKFDKSFATLVKAWGRQKNIRKEKIKKTKSTSQLPRTLIKNAILLAIIALALSVSPRSRGDAALCGCTRYWCNPGAGDWFDPSNWCPYQDYVPGYGGPICPVDGGITEANVNNGGTAQISGLAQTAHACEVFLGRNNSTESGTLSVNHGTLEQCNVMWVGYYGKGTLSITNGGLVTTPVEAYVAAYSGSNGAATVDGSNPDGRKSTWTVNGEYGLFVAGTNTAAGGTGLLTVSNQGRVNAANVHVYKSGTLTGNGMVSTSNGTTTIDGTLVPRGTLTIDGNLTFANPNANMQCDVTSNSWDRAEVSGAATLNGKLSVTLNGFFTGDFPLLHASGLTGQFSSYSFTYTGCLAPSIRYINGDVILHVEATC